jgi:hypothetical protein
VLEGVVRYLDGRPVPGLRVEVTAADGRRASWRVGGARLIEDDRGQLQPDWSGSRRRIETDADGRYRVSGLASGVALTVTTNGTYATQGRLAGITLAPDEVRSGADLEVDVAGRLSLKLAPGTPQGAWRVVLKRVVEEGRPETSGTTLWGNRARTLDALRAGEWTLEVFAQGGGEPVLQRTVEVIAEQVQDVTIEVQ